LKRNILLVLLALILLSSCRTKPYNEEPTPPPEPYSIRMVVKGHAVAGQKDFYMPGKPDENTLYLSVNESYTFTVAETEESVTTSPRKWYRNTDLISESDTFPYLAKAADDGMVIKVQYSKKANYDTSEEKIIKTSISYIDGNPFIPAEHRSIRIFDYLFLNYAQVNSISAPILKAIAYKENTGFDANPTSGDGYGLMQVRGVGKELAKADPLLSIKYGAEIYKTYQDTVFNRSEVKYRMWVSLKDTPLNFPEDYSEETSNSNGDSVPFDTISNISKYRMAISAYNGGFAVPISDLCYAHNLNGWIANPDDQDYVLEWEDFGIKQGIRSIMKYHFENQYYPSIEINHYYILVPDFFGGDWNSIPKQLYVKSNSSACTNSNCALTNINYVAYVISGTDYYGNYQSGYAQAFGGYYY